MAEGILHYLLILAVLLLITFSVMLYFSHAKYYPSTDKAYVKANIIQTLKRLKMAIFMRGRECRCHN